MAWKESSETDHVRTAADVGQFDPARGSSRPAPEDGLRLMRAFVSIQAHCARGNHRARYEAVGGRRSTKIAFSGQSGNQAAALVRIAPVGVGSLSSRLSLSAAPSFASAPSSATLTDFDDLVRGTSIFSPKPVNIQYASIGVVSFPIRQAL